MIILERRGVLGKQMNLMHVRCCPAARLLVQVPAAKWLGLLVRADCWYQGLPDDLKIFSTPD